MHKQTSRVSLATTQSDEARFERRRLDSAFLAIVRALPCRPSPRNAWDNRARRDQRVPHPCADAIALCRQAIEAANATRDVNIIRATRLEIEEYFDLCKAAATRLPVRPAATLPSVLPLGAASSSSSHLALIKEQAEATTAVAESIALPSETTMERARREVREAVDAGLTFLKSCGIHSHSAATPARRAIS